MKIRSFAAIALVIFAVAGTSQVLMSCEDDEKKEVLIPVEASGRFNGAQTVDVQNGQLLHQTIGDMNVTISPITGDTEHVKITFPGISLNISHPKAPITGVDVKEIVVNKVNVNKLGDGSYVFSGTINLTTQIRMGNAKLPKENQKYQDYEAKNATIAGTLKEGTLNLKLSYTPGTMPMPITYTYTGKRA